MTTEYLREQERHRRSREARRVDLVRDILAGDRSYIDELRYDFEASHVALVAAGRHVERATRSLRARASGPFLAVSPQEGIVWVWLGGLARPDIARLGDLAASDLGSVSVAVGEPADGHAGFCTSHSQALAALRVARYLRQPVTYYADVALVAAMLENEGLAQSLIQLYAAPLGTEAWGGTVRRVLRAYFSVGCNASAAASLLGLERRTVANHIQRAEEVLGRSVHSIQAELEIALRLEELTVGVGQHDA